MFSSLCKWCLRREHFLMLSYQISSICILILTFRLLLWSSSKLTLIVTPQMVLDFSSSIDRPSANQDWNLRYMPTIDIFYQTLQTRHTPSYTNFPIFCFSFSKVLFIWISEQATSSIQTTVKWYYLYLELGAIKRLMQPKSQIVWNISGLLGSVQKIDHLWESPSQRDKIGYGVEGYRPNAGKCFIIDGQMP